MRVEQEGEKESACILGGYIQAQKKGKNVSLSQSASHSHYCEH